MILSWGFNALKDVPFVQLIEHIGSKKWEQLKKALDMESAENLLYLLQKEISGAALR